MQGKAFQSWIGLQESESLLEQPKGLHTFMKIVSDNYPSHSLKIIFFHIYGINIMNAEMFIFTELSACHFQVILALSTGTSKPQISYLMNIMKPRFFTRYFFKKKSLIIWNPDSVFICFSELLMWKM